MIDGGVLNPLPIAPTVADNTDLTIAVNVSANVTKEYKIDIPKKEHEKESVMQEIFFEIGIPNDACGFYEFDKAYKMIELGKLITQDHLSKDK